MIKGRHKLPLSYKSEIVDVPLAHIRLDPQTRTRQERKDYRKISLFSVIKKSYKKKN